MLPGRQSPWVGILFSTALALGLIYYVTNSTNADGEPTNVVSNLSNVTALLLLCVFAIVNIACVVLRRKDPRAKKFFTSPGQLPLVAAALCLFLVGPWVDREPTVYKIAAGLMAIGVALWLITFLVNKATGVGDSDFEDIESLGG